jgi:hypothetical protein
MSSRALALAAAALAAAAVAAPVLAQSSAGGQTLTFRVLNKGSHFHYVDNPPRNNNPHRRPVFSVGDGFVLASPLADNSGTIGELRVTCTVTKKASATNSLNPGHPLCTGAFDTKNGTLFAETVDSGAKRTNGAIVGGTGAYAGARGTFTGTTAKTGETDTVNLLP